MGQTITIRMTPKRERLLKLFKKRFNLKKNSDAIELALKMSTREEVDYQARIAQVAGCVRTRDGMDAVDSIRSLRDGS